MTSRHDSRLSTAVLTALLALCLIGTHARAADRDEQLQSLGRELVKPFSAAPERDARPVVIVWPLRTTEEHKPLAGYLEVQLINVLTGTGGERVRVIARQHRKNVLDENAFAASPLIDPKTALEPCKLLAAEYAVTADLKVHPTKIELTAFVLRVETGETLCTGKAALEVDNDLIDMIRVLKAGQEQSVELPAQKFADPSPGGKQMALGDLLLQRGQTAEATKAYLRALKDPNIQPEQKAAVLARLGYLAQKAGKKEIAEKHYREALELDPNNRTVQAYLSVLRLQQTSREVTAKRYGAEYGRQVERLLAQWLGEQKGSERLMKEMFFGIELVVLQKQGGRLRAVKVDQGGTLYSGTSRFKVIFNASEPCYVYLWNMDSTGKIWPVWPDVPANAPKGWRSRHIKGDQNYENPTGNDWFILDNNVGTEFFFYVVSTKPLPQLDQSMVWFRRHLNPGTRQHTATRGFQPDSIRTRSVRGIGTRGIMKKVSVQTQPGGAQPVEVQIQTLALTGAEACGVIWFKHENPPE